MAQRSQISKQRTIAKDNTSNRSFFANIKSQLSNIKNDVNKLAKKQGQQDPKKINPQVIQADFKKRIVEEKQENYLQNEDEKKQLRQRINHLEKQVTSQREKMGQIMSKFQEQKNQFQAYHKNSQKAQQSLIIQNKNLKDRIFQFTQILQRQQSNKKHNQVNNSTKVTEKLKVLQDQHQQIIRKMQQQLISQTYDKNRHIKQNERLKISIGQLDKKINILTSQNDRLRRQIEDIKNNNQIEVEKLLNTDKEQKEVNFQQLGECFQKKINSLIEENYQLKNRCSWFQSKIEELQMKNKFNQQTIQAYEQRDRDSSLPTNFQEQINFLNEKIQELKDQKDQLISNHELEIMKLQNQIDDLKNSKDNGNNTTLNQILKDQITQIEHLRKKIKEKQSEISKLNERR